MLYLKKKATDAVSKIRLIDKVQVSKENIFKGLDLGVYHVIVFSGGKDSLIVLYPTL